MPERLHTTSQSRLAALLPYFEAELGPWLCQALGGFCRLVVADPQGNLNYTFLVYCNQAKLPCAVLKIKNRREMEHPLTKVLSAPYAKESAVLVRCAAAGLPVPRPLADVFKLNKRKASAGPFVCSLTSYIRGVNARSLAAPNSAAENDFINQAGRLVRELHGITFNKFGEKLSPSGDFSLTWKAHITKLFAGIIKNTRKFISASAAKDFNARFLDLKKIKGPGVLVHADLHLGNLLINARKGTVVGLIDWERSRSSRPSEEFARILYENFVLAQRFSVREIAAILGGDGVSPQFRCFLSGYGLSVANYHKYWRHEVESILMLLAGGFWSRFELNLKKVRPDWEKPASYAQQVVRSILKYSSC